MTELPDSIWLWLADNGNIRKWDRKPFDEVPMHAAIRAYLSTAENAGLAGARAIAAEQVASTVSVSIPSPPPDPSGLEALVERLREIHCPPRHREVVNEAADTLDALSADRASCQARVEELERALKPFAQYADDEWTEHHRDDTPILDHEGEFIAKLGDFRAARSALEGK